MKIRWKMLIAMLSISLVPMLLMRGVGQRGMRNLGNELATRTRDVLIDRAYLELKVLAEEHVRILKRERDLIEMALKLQASELEKQFSGNRLQNLKTKGPHLSENRSKKGGFLPSKKHFRVMGMKRRFMPLYVSYDQQSYLKSYRAPKRDPAYVSGLSSMVPVYRSLAKKHSDLILWQITALENGTQTVYPALQRYPRWYDALKTDWYQKTRNKKDIVWSMPVADPFTRQLVLIVSAPLLEADGTLLGATSIMIPVSVVLKEDEHVRDLSENVTSLLVRPEFSPSLDRTAIRIVAHEHKLGQMHHHWQAAQPDEWLAVDDKKSIHRLIEDLPKQRSGVIGMSYKGDESLAAYGTIDEFGSALMLVVKKSDIVAEAAKMEGYVLERIGKQINITSVILLGIFIIVICMALILSRSVTGNIQKLVAASRNIASGDFRTRARISSKDEMGELGRTFDRMVPELEERLQMKQALDVAMQVQQSLLPQKMPQFDGIDIAARSIYCDETGGDFYDFMDFCCREPDVVGAVIGDVSGHGIPAALLMASARAFLRCRITQPGDIAEIINDVNQLVAEDVGETGHFLTLFYMELNARQKNVKWIRAGHDPALVYCPAGDRFEELRGKGLPLGVEDNTEYFHNTRDGLSSGQIIIAGTDGVWETQNAAGKMFGKNRLKDIIRRHWQSAPENILTAILQELEVFRGDVKQEDDVTLVIMKIK